MYYIQAYESNLGIVMKPSVEKEKKRVFGFARIETRE